MNLILLDGDRPSPRQCRHMIEVLGVEVGRRLRVGRRRGPRGWARVSAVDGDRVELEIEALDQPAARPLTSLIAAVPRPKVVPRLVAAAASLGVDHVALTRAWRVDKSYLGSPALAPEALDAAAVLGCEQGGHTWVPDVEVHDLFRDMLAAAAKSGDAALRLVAHPVAARRLEDAARVAARRPAVLAIGPEGGWIEREVEGLVGAGFVAVRSGARILRSEVAVAVLLGQLALLRRLSVE